MFFSVFSRLLVRGGDILETTRHTNRLIEALPSKPSKSRASHEGGFSPTLSYPNFGRPIREGAKRALSRSRVPGPGSGRDGRRVLTGRAGLGVLAGVRGEEPGGGGSGWCVADVIVSSRADAVAFTPRARRRARRASAPARRRRSRRARRESRARGGRAPPSNSRPARRFRRPFPPPIAEKR